jgi:hypothetical protein
VGVEPPRQRPAQGRVRAVVGRFRCDLVLDVDRCRKRRRADLRAENRGQRIGETALLWRQWPGLSLVRSSDRETWGPTEVLAPEAPVDPNTLSLEDIGSNTFVAGWRECDNGCDLLVSTSQTPRPASEPSPSPSPSEPPFGDVSGDPTSPIYSAFADEIAWVSEQGIATGYDSPSGSEYRPFGNVTRDAMAAFLYRLAGETDYTPPATSRFIDVKADDPFYTEISWLAERGISTGWSTSAGVEYRPFQPITRDAMAAFLDRFMRLDEPAPPRDSPFVDVRTGDPFYREISALVFWRVSTGWKAPGPAGYQQEFRPYEHITRDAMAAFLYRASNLLGSD